MNVVRCNREQADKLLSQLFSKQPKITNVSYDYDDEVYLITAKTNPGGYKTQWQYRPGVGLCFGEIYIGNKRYDIYEHDSNLLGVFDKVAQAAIEEWDDDDNVIIYFDGKESGKIIDGNVLLAKIINALICICGAILIMISAYNQWSMYGEYTVFSFLCSLFLHGGFMFMIYLGINWVIDHLFNKDNEEI